LIRKYYQENPGPGAIGIPQFLKRIFWPVFPIASDITPGRGCFIRSLTS